MLTTGIAATVAATAVMAPGDTAPVGWTATAGANGSTIYVPGDLKPGEEMKIAVYPAQKIGSEAVDEWLMAFAKNDGVGDAPVLQDKTVEVASVVRMFPAPDGSRHARIYTAKKTGGAVRVIRMTMSAGSDLSARYKTALNSIVQSAMNSATAVPKAAPTKTGTTKTTPATGSAKRPAFVVAPGKGVPPSQIAAILHEYDVEIYSAGTNGTGTNVTDEAYLLLKDGTVHKGLPVPPDSFDAAASRKSEPKAWGKWRKSGAGYEVAFSGAFKKLDARPVIAVPGGAKLSGRYGTGSSSASLASSSYSLWGVTFTPGGRFKKDGRGGSGNSLFMQTGGAPAINSTYDDNGSVTSVTTESSTVMAKKNNPNGNKEGTYSISGMVMTLIYDNGAVERIPFFYTQTNKKTIFFEGNQLAFDDGK